MARARTPKPGTRIPPVHSTVTVTAGTIERIVDLVRLGRTIEHNGDLGFDKAVLARMVDVVNRAWPPAIPAEVVRAVAAYVTSTPPPPGTGAHPVPTPEAEP